MSDIFDVILSELFSLSTDEAMQVILCIGQTCDRIATPENDSPQIILDLQKEKKLFIDLLCFVGTKFREQSSPSPAVLDHLTSIFHPFFRFCASDYDSSSPFFSCLHVLLLSPHLRGERRREIFLSRYPQFGSAIWDEGL